MGVSGRVEERQERIKMRQNYKANKMRREEAKKKKKEEKRLKLFNRHNENPAAPPVNEVLPDAGPAL